jgi:hypothetical protein
MWGVIVGIYAARLIEGIFANAETARYLFRRCYLFGFHGVPVPLARHPII